MGRATTFSEISLSAVSARLGRSIPFDFLGQNTWLVEMAYCTECGSEVSDEDKFCPECGSPVERSSTEDTTHETRTTTEQEEEPSIWGAFAILGLWILFFMTFPGMEGDESMRALAGFVVLISLPIIWYDAREAKRAVNLK